MIILTKNIEEATFVTHAGKFHADEVFGSILLEKIYGDLKIIRVPEIDGLKLENKIIYDIGGGKFDHHQIGGNGQRLNGVKYAAFGLLWKEYGKIFLKEIGAQNVDDCFEMFDKNFVQFIDAGDNGQIEFEKIDLKLVTLSDIIEGYNPNWNEDIDADDCFILALDIARNIFNNKINSIIAKCQAKQFVEEAIEKSKNGIMILDKYMPYTEFVFESKNPKANDILYVIFESNRKGYTIKAMPIKLGSFINKKSFPKSWAGLRNEDLQKISGIKTATFCHNNRFICVVEKFEDALKLAEIAVDS